MISENFVIFPIILPIIAGLISLVFRSKPLNYLVNFSGIFLALLSCIYIAKYLNQSDSLNFFVAGWRPPRGIELKIDKYSFLFIFFSILCYLANFFYLSRIAHNVSIRYLTSLMIFSLAGSIGMASTNDLFNLYVFLEINSICSYSLASFGENKFRYLTSLEYLIIGSVASCLILLGIGLIYLDSATLNISDIISRLEIMNYPKVSSLGISFVFVGLIIKSGFFPISSWFTRVYAHSHHFMISFFSFTSSSIYLFLLMKFIYFTFNHFFLTNILFKIILHIIGLSSCFIFSIRSLYSQNLREILSFSSISNFGYVLLSISFLDKQTFISGNLLFYSHLLSKTSFLIINSILEEKLGRKLFLTDLAKFVKNNYFLGMIVFCNLFVLAGLPLSLIFNAKFEILQHLLNSKYYLVSFIFLSTIFCNFLYVGQILKPYFITPPTISEKSLDFSLGISVFLPLSFLTLLNILLHLKVSFFTKFIN